MPKGTAPLMLCNVTEHPSDSHADIVPDEPRQCSHRASFSEHQGSGPAHRRQA